MSGPRTRRRSEQGAEHVLLQLGFEQVLALAPVREGALQRARLAHPCARLGSAAHHADFVDERRTEEVVVGEDTLAPDEQDIE